MRIPLPLGRGSENGFRARACLNFCSLVLVFVVLLSHPLAGQQYVVSTIAGIGAPGYAGDGGPALSAQLSNPLCIALDSSGNYYIADYGNYVIRKVDARTGIMTTVAGNGTLGFSGDGGPATEAQLSSVHGLAVDSAGNLYISDTTNSRVRVVDTAGNISTFAGIGFRGYSGDGGPAVNASMSWPAGLALDKAGNVYIADFGNGTVRKVLPNGFITTAAGIGLVGYGGFFGEGGLAINASLEQPYAVSLDPAGNLYIGDLGSSRILRVGSDGRIRTFASGISMANMVSDTTGNLYVSNYHNSTIARVLQDGTQVTIGGTTARSYGGDGGPSIYAAFNVPYGVAIDSSGNLYVADYGNSAIRLLTPIPSSGLIVANGASNIGFGYSPSGIRNVPLPIAPGEVVALFGTGFPPSAKGSPDGNGVIARTLSGLVVTFNGIPAPIISNTGYQVIAIAPYQLSGASQAAIAITGPQGNIIASATVPVTAAEPEIFVSGSAASVGTTFAGYPPLNSDGGVNSASNAAAESSTITLFITGVGLTSPAGVDGLITAGPDFPQPVLPVSVLINGENAAIASIGGAQFQVSGVIQINVTLPSDVTTNSSVPVQVVAGGATSLAIGVAVQ
jgi:uncharacterized protein (TIGR03437 family)